MKEIAASSEKNNYKIMFFDEGRFGTMTSIRRKWSLKGSKCEVKIKQGYKNFYVYSSLCPESGEIFSLYLPRVNTKMMNIYLEELSNYFSREKLILIMDCAGWHKSKDLKVPDNIEIEYLPPYSPELNPVERLWKWLKNNTIHNRIFEKLEDIMASLTDELKALTREKIMSLCRCSYL
jgi:transposase